MTGQSSLAYGQARCGCGAVYPAKNGKSVNRRIVCPSCAISHAASMQLAAAKKLNQAANLALRAARGGRRW